MWSLFIVKNNNNSVVKSNFHNRILDKKKHLLKFKKTIFIIGRLNPC